MARIYSYELIFKTLHVNSLLHDFKKLLTSKSSSKLTLNKRWNPEGYYKINGKKIQIGIKGVREQIDDENSYRFSFAFPKNPSFSITAEELGFNKEEGIGCIWTELIVGERWGILELISATSSISALLKNEILQQEIVNSFKGTCEAIIFHMDSESLILYPFSVSLKYDMHKMTTSQVDADLYLDDLLKRSGI
ncbi:hypothetical protein WJR50_14150 [Catalinimonas sp. 4WD22]|uniref:hypothetical protein n=1 Tax=Catalinimonas locisalis TaxID=3133978 RepID=UPI003101773C